MGRNIPKTYNDEPLGRYSSLPKVYTGFVKDNRDFIRMGRLKVWVPELSPDPEDESRWIMVSYASPFAGATPISDNVENSENFQDTQKSYGFWFVPPDIDNQVLIAFADGDPAKGFWFACIYDQYMNNMVPGISTNTSFEDGNKPTAEYNKKDDSVNAGSPIRPEFQPLFLGLGKQGLRNEFTRGENFSSARRSSPPRSYGILTPRGNQFVYDDGFREEERERENRKIPKEENPSNEKEKESFNPDKRKDEYIRFRTRSGAQVLISETDGFIYIISRDGNSWVEISNNGEIDVWGRKDISLRSNENINIRADKDINMEAGRNFNVRATKQWDKPGSPKTNEGEGEGGIFKLETWDDTIFKVLKNFSMQTTKETQVKSGKNIEFTTDEKFEVKAKDNIDLTTDKEFQVKSGANIELTTDASSNIKAADQHIEEASVIHMNGPSASEASEAKEADDIEKFKPIKRTDKDLPNSKIGDYKNQKTSTINKRIPQHEPYLNHDIRTTGLRGRVEESPELQNLTQEEERVTNSSSNKRGVAAESVQTPDGKKTKTGSSNGEPVYMKEKTEEEFSPSENLSASEEGIDLISDFEGFESEVYEDSAGVETIGFGHKLSKSELESGTINVNGKNINFRDGISREDAEKILKEDVKQAEQTVRNNVNVQLSQNQFDSLTSFVYNVGPGNFKRSSLLKKLNNKQYEEVSSEMMKWNSADGTVLSGLQKRRDEEANLFNS